MIPKVPRNRNNLEVVERPRNFQSYKDLISQFGDRSDKCGKVVKKSTVRIRNDLTKERG